MVGGRYRHLRAVGSGASAHVYVAEDVRLRRRVALKVLHPALAEDKSFLRRFQAEAQIVAPLRHPGIVRVYDWGEDGGAAYLAMELLEGGSLRAFPTAGTVSTSLKPPPWASTSPPRSPMRTPEAWSTGT